MCASDAKGKDKERDKPKKEKESMDEALKRVKAIADQQDTEEYDIDRDPRALDPLEMALKSGDANLRLMVIEGLSYLKNAKSVEILTTLLDDEDERVQKAAKEAIKTLEEGELKPLYER